MASVWPAKNNYATGDVLTAANMNGVGDDLNDVYGYSFTNNFFAGKNKIINGDFYINQRNFTSNTTNGAYMFDRWFADFGGGTVTFTPQTFTPGTAPVSGYEGKQYMQVAISGQTGSNYASFSQRIEDVRTLAGQTVTLSFWAKAAAGTPSIQPISFQRFGTGGSPSAAVVSGGSATPITTSWARYSWTFALASLSGKTFGTNNDSSLEIELMLSQGGGVGLNNTTFSIWGVQLEAGSTATPFQTATGTKQGELAACQRYYQRWANTQTGGFANTSEIAIAEIRNSTTAYVVIPTLTPMRGSPTIGLSAASTFSLNSAGKSGAASSIGANTTTYYPLSLVITVTGYTAGQAGWFYMSAGGYIEGISEL